MQTDFKTHALIITLAGTAILATALASEIWGGLTPCALCLQQRWPYYIALPLTALVWVGGDRAPIALQGLLVPVGVIFAAGAALGFYHAGVEYVLWAGPSRCGGGSSGFETTADLLTPWRVPSRCAVMKQLSRFSAYPWRGIIFLQVPAWQFWPGTVPRAQCLKRHHGKR